MNRHRIFNTVAFVLIGIFTVLYLQMVFSNFRLFETGLDLGAYAQALFNLSHFRLPFNTFKNMVMWGDHAHFIIALFAPIYRLFPDARVLLVAQVLVVTLSGYPLYKIAQKILNSSLLGLAFLYAYLAFIGTQYALNVDFHPSVLTGGIILWFIYAWHFDKKILFWISLVLGLITREDAPPIFFMLGLFYFLQQIGVFVRARIRKQSFDKKKILIWLSVMIISFTYFCVVAYIIMPQWTRGGDALTYLDTGNKDPYSVVRGFFVYPKAIFQNMTDTETKRNTINTLFSSFGYLPAFTPLTYLSGLTIFYSRFASPNEYRWLINNYSNGNILPLLAIGGIYSISYLFWLLNKVRLNRLKNVFVVIICALLIFSVQKNAWSDKKAPLYRARARHIMPTELITKHNEAVTKALEIIPTDDTVAVSSGFTARFANRRNLQLYPEINSSTQWLIVSQFVSSWPLQQGSMEHEITVLQNDKNFSQVWSGDGTYIFKRISASESSAPKNNPSTPDTED
ncbi:MAG: DUF2079 domain-containing protein [bacterium]|nr:DUF2079 domain-containing protein [bacterium]